MKTKISTFLKERPDRFKPEEANKLGLMRLYKINFSGEIHLAEKPTNTNMILIKSGDLVISGINVEKGAVAVYQGEEDILATIHYSSYEFDKSKIDINYFKWFLKSDSFRKIVQSQTRGGIKTELKSKKFLPLEIDLPDLKSQKQILEKINSMKNEINELEQNVSYDKTLLKKLKQSILSEAVSGRFIKEYPLGNLLQFTKNGYSGKPNELRIGVIRLGIETVTQSNFIKVDIEKAKSIEIPEDKKLKYFVKNKDLFVCRQNGNLNFVGKTAVFLGEDDKIIFSDSLIQLRPRSDIVNSKFLAIFLNSKIARIQLDEFCSTTAGNFSINGANLKKVIVPLPPIFEQKRIVEKVDFLMGVCDELDLMIGENRESSERLIGVVLGEVFSSE